ncbi:sensory box histidine kinase/response regulator [alpha proteobacterium U9-1i]|nr:sensory box histidine kinase/response regulator [alpha proteobacterium U9-1i]
MALPAASQAFDAFEALPDPAAILAPDGALLRANANFRQTFRHWIGPNRAPWGRVQPPAFENGERRFDAPAPDGRTFEWIDRLLPDGARFVTARDVTRHTRAAEESLRAKTTLFATLTHELRTPLNGILGITGLLAQTKLEPAPRSYLDAIRQSGEHLLDLITEILDYSRLEAGRIQLEQTPFDPEAAMQAVAELLSPKAYEKGLDIAVSVRSDTPARVIGDDGRLRQILFNLAGNAVKFTTSGGVLIDLAPRGEGRLRFTVRDTGPGIAAEKQAMIFEEFSQADEGVARRFGGAGLGLAIVKRLAQAMGGEVGLTSRVDQGSSFWVELPLSAAPSGETPIALQGVRVAIISEAQILSQALRAIITSFGGLAVARDDRPDLILYDWRGEPDGEEIAGLQTMAPAMIAIIAQENRAAIERCRAAGLQHYALKPLRRRALAERIRIALGLSGDAQPSMQGPQEHSAEALVGLRVLLAEDNPINALLARTLLTRQGCIVDVVHDGEEAVVAASSAPYDLMLLDVRMPRVDGLEAARRIRALGGAIGKTPIVALTADAGEEDRTRALKAGMNEFITKPIDAERLLAVAARFTTRPNPATFAAD